MLWQYQYLFSLADLALFRWNNQDLTSPRSTPTAKSLKELRSVESPDCVTTMLKVLQIRNFKPNRLQISVLRYVLDNAEILGSVILSSPNPITEEEKARILAFPKASPHASVLFEWPKVDLLQFSVPCGLRQSYYLCFDHHWNFDIKTLCGFSDSKKRICLLDKF